MGVGHRHKQTAHVVGQGEDAAAGIGDRQELVERPVGVAGDAALAVLDLGDLPSPSKRRRMVTPSGRITAEGVASGTPLASS